MARASSCASSCFLVLFQPSSHASLAQDANRRCIYLIHTAVRHAYGVLSHDPCSDYLRFLCITCAFPCASHPYLGTCTCTARIPGKMTPGVADTGMGQAERLGVLHAPGTFVHGRGCIILARLGGTRCINKYLLEFKSEWGREAGSRVFSSSSLHGCT